MKQARRELLRGAAAALLASALPALGQAATAHRRLRFFHTHTGEKLNIVYFEAGHYVADALGEINQFLRDHRTGDVHKVDPALLDQLAAVQRLSGRREAFEVISGYRSPATNEMLRQRTNGVARRSLHMQGRAIDVRLRGLSTEELRRAALSLGAGGVGYYPESAFVHLDTGPARAW